jgi:hypothetical protein
MNTEDRQALRERQSRRNRIRRLELTPKERQIWVDRALLAPASGILYKPHDEVSPEYRVGEEHKELRRLKSPFSRLELLRRSHLGKPC